MAEKKKPGRKRKLAPATAARNKLLDLLRKGVSRTAAVSLAGIVYQTLLSEIERDEGFQKQIAEAEDCGRAKLEERFFAASADDWKAAKAFLERKYHEDWAQRRPDSIDVRQLARHLPALVAIVLEFTAKERHDELKEKVDRWLENLLDNDRNAQ